MSEFGDVLIVILIILSVVFTVGFCVAAIFYDFGLDIGNGEQTGYISEVEYNGWIWQTTQISLISINPTYSSEDTAWHYATPNKEITDKAKEFMKEHTPVIVKYETRRITGRWEYSHRVIITDIIPVGKEV